MANKTKAELMEEIKDLNERIKRLDRYKQYEDAADELAAMRDSFVNAGFTKTEAFTMVRTMMQLAVNPFMNLR
jgi:predicted  nucleic acid-binding Zn-ribbon protein